MFSYFFKRELKDKYLGNITGFSWVFIQPLITLLIYWFVFDKIFHSRYVSDAKEISFIVYLAIGFWPWMAFSESVIRSITAVSDKSDLIGKVNINLKTAVFASISATFSLHLLGYLFVLIGLMIFNENLDYHTIPLIIFPLIQLYLFALSLGLLLSSLQIFVRDTLLLMTTLITLWFFLTPIIYSESILPENYKSIIRMNPLYTPISFIHKAVLAEGKLPWFDLSILTLVTLILLYAAVKIFNKLSPHFEDFK